MPLSACDSSSNTRSMLRKRPDVSVRRNQGASEDGSRRRAWPDVRCGRLAEAVDQDLGRSSSCVFAIKAVASVNAAHGLDRSGMPAIAADPLAGASVPDRQTIAGP